MTKAALPIVFVHAATLPSQAANALQTMQMADAAAGEGMSVRLACWVEPGKTVEDVNAYYSMAPRFELMQAPMKLPRNGLRSFALAAWLVRRLGRKWICHTRLPSIAAFTGWLGIPTILELHGLPTAPSQVRLMPLVSRAPGLRKVVVISDGLRRQVEAHYPRLAKRGITIAHDAVDLAAFDIDVPREEARAQLGLPLDTPIIGYTGRVTNGHGVRVLLEATEGLAVTTVIVGGGRTGDPADITEELKARFGDASVRFLGHQSHGAIPLLLRAFDLSVAPYTGEAIGQFQSGGRTIVNETSSIMSPLKIFEYMASGTPMIVSDFPVIHEVLTPDETAYFVTPNDPAALRAAIQAALADPDGARRIQEWAHAEAQSRSWGERANKLFADLV
jgi:glycosyltransferase involved in cell wall biosynthesis